MSEKIIYKVKPNYSFDIIILIIIFIFIAINGIDNLLNVLLIYASILLGIYVIGKFFVKQIIIYDEFIEFKYSITKSNKRNVKYPYCEIHKVKIKNNGHPMSLKLEIRKSEIGYDKNFNFYYIKRKDIKFIKDFFKDKGILVETFTD